MKRVVWLTLILAGCQYGTPSMDDITGRGGKKEAGEVAIRCVDQMASCEDWVPINMARDKKPREEPLCYDLDKYTEARRECEDRAEAARYYNKMLADTPNHRSPCQQRIDSCVEMVRALIQTETHIHKHEHKEK